MIHYREKEKKKKEEDSPDDPSYRDGYQYQYIPILGYCYDLHLATAAARDADADDAVADDL